MVHTVKYYSSKLLLPLISNTDRSETTFLYYTSSFLFKLYTFCFRNLYNEEGVMSCDCSKWFEMSKQGMKQGCLSDGDVSMPVPASSFQIHWKEFMCGGGSAFCNILITYPLNKLIFRQVIY